MKATIVGILLFAVGAQAETGLDAVDFDAPVASYLACAKVPMEMMPQERTVAADRRSRSIVVEQACLVKIEKAYNYVLEDKNGDGLIFRVNPQAEAFLVGEIHQKRVSWADRRAYTHVIGKIVPVYRAIKASTASRIDTLAVNIFESFRWNFTGFKAVGRYDDQNPPPPPAPEDLPVPVRVP